MAAVVLVVVVVSVFAAAAVVAVVEVVASVEGVVDSALWQVVCVEVFCSASDPAVSSLPHRVSPARSKAAKFLSASFF